MFLKMMCQINLATFAFFTLVFTTTGAKSQLEEDKSKGTELIFDINDEHKAQYLNQNFYSNAYNYGYEVNPNGQFHHEVHGPDDVTYGCYGYVDPLDKLKTTFYISDGWGYRVVKPGQNVELFFHKHEHPNEENQSEKNKNDDNHDHHGILTAWNKLHFPPVCAQFEKTNNNPNIVSSPDHGTPKNPGIPGIPKHPTIPDTPRTPPSRPIHPEKSETPTVPRRPEHSGIPTSPKTPDISKGSKIPDIHRTPSHPEYPEKPDIHRTPSHPEYPEKPDIHRTPSHSEYPEKPDIPGTPTTPKIPGISTVPENPETHRTPPRPEYSKKPGIPSTPTTPKIPGIPRIPDVSEKQRTPSHPGFPREPAKSEIWSTSDLPEKSFYPEYPGTSGTSVTPGKPFQPPNGGGSRTPIIVEKPTQPVFDHSDGSNTHGTFIILNTPKKSDTSDVPGIIRTPSHSSTYKIFGTPGKEDNFGIPSSTGTPSYFKDPGTPKTSGSPGTPITPNILSQPVDADSPKKADDESSSSSETEESQSSENQTESSGDTPSKETGPSSTETVTQESASPPSQSGTSRILSPPVTTDKSSHPVRQSTPENLAIPGPSNTQTIPKPHEYVEEESSSSVDESDRFRVRSPKLVSRQGSPEKRSHELSRESVQGPSLQTTISKLPIKIYFDIEKSKMSLTPVTDDEPKEPSVAEKPSTSYQKSPPRPRTPISSEESQFPPEHTLPHSPTKQQRKQDVPKEQSSSLSGSTQFFDIELVPIRTPEYPRTPDIRSTVPSQQQIPIDEPSTSGTAAPLSRQSSDSTTPKPSWELFSSQLSPRQPPSEHPAIEEIPKAPSPTLPGPSRPFVSIFDPLKTPEHSIASDIKDKVYSPEKDQIGEPSITDRTASLSRQSSDSTTPMTSEEIEFPSERSPTLSPTQLPLEHLMIEEAPKAPSSSKPGSSSSQPGSSSSQPGSSSSQPGSSSSKPDSSSSKPSLSKYYNIEMVPIKTPEYPVTPDIRDSSSSPQYTPIPVPSTSGKTASLSRQSSDSITPMPSEEIHLSSERSSTQSPVEDLPRDDVPKTPSPTLPGPSRTFLSHFDPIKTPEYPVTPDIRHSSSSSEHIPIAVPRIRGKTFPTSRQSSDSVSIPSEEIQHSSKRSSTLSPVEDLPRDDVPKTPSPTLLGSSRTIVSHIDPIKTPEYSVTREIRDTVSSPKQIPIAVPSTSSTSTPSDLTTRMPSKEISQASEQPSTSESLKSILKSLFTMGISSDSKRSMPREEISSSPKQLSEQTLLETLEAEKDTEARFSPIPGTSKTLYSDLGQTETQEHPVASDIRDSSSSPQYIPIAVPSTSGKTATLSRQSSDSTSIPSEEIQHSSERSPTQSPSEHSSKEEVLKSPSPLLPSPSRTIISHFDPIKTPEYSVAPDIRESETTPERDPIDEPIASGTRPPLERQSSETSPSHLANLSKTREKIVEIIGLQAWHELEDSFFQSQATHPSATPLSESSQSPLIDSGPIREPSTSGKTAATIGKPSPFRTPLTPTQEGQISTDQSPRQLFLKSLQLKKVTDVKVSPIPGTSQFLSSHLSPTKTQEHPVAPDIRESETTPERDPIDEPIASGTRPPLERQSSETSPTHSVNLSNIRDIIVEIIGLQAWHELEDSFLQNQATHPSATPLSESSQSPLIDSGPITVPSTSGKTAATIGKPSPLPTPPMPTQESQTFSDQPSEQSFLESLQTERSTDVRVSPIPGTSQFLSSHLSPTKTQVHPVAPDIRDIVSAPEKSLIMAPRTSGKPAASIGKPSPLPTPPMPTQESRISTDQSPKQSIFESSQAEKDTEARFSPIPGTSKTLYSDLGQTETQEHPVAPDIRDIASASEKDPIAAPSTSGKTAHLRRLSSDSTTIPSEELEFSSERSSTQSPSEYSSKGEVFKYPSPTLPGPSTTSVSYFDPIKTPEPSVEPIESSTHAPSERRSSDSSSSHASLILRVHGKVIENIGSEAWAELESSFFQGQDVHPSTPPISESFKTPFTDSGPITSPSTRGKHAASIGKPSPLPTLPTPAQERDADVSVSSVASTSQSVFQDSGSDRTQEQPVTDTTRATISSLRKRRIDSSGASSISSESPPSRFSETVTSSSTKEVKEASEHLSRSKPVESQMMKLVGEEPSPDSDFSKPREGISSSPKSISKKQLLETLEEEKDTDVRFSPIPGTSRPLYSDFGPVETLELPIDPEIRDIATAPETDPMRTPSTSGTSAALIKEPSPGKTTPSPTRKRRISTLSSPTLSVPSEQSSVEEGSKALSPTSPGPYRGFVSIFEPLGTPDYQITSDIRDDVSTPEKDPTEATRLTIKLYPLKKKSSDYTSPKPSWELFSPEGSSKESQSESLQTEKDTDVRVSPKPGTSQSVSPDLSPTKTQEQPVAPEIRDTRTVPEEDPIAVPSTSGTTKSLTEYPSPEKTTPSPSKKRGLSTDESSEESLLQSLQKDADTDAPISTIPSTSTSFHSDLSPTEGQEGTLRISRPARLPTTKKKSTDAPKTSDTSPPVDTTTSDISHTVSSPEKDPAKDPSTSGTTTVLQTKPSSEKTTPSSIKISKKFPKKPLKKPLVKSLQTETDPNIRVPPIPGTSTSFHSDLSPTEGQEHTMRISRPAKLPTTKKKSTDAPKTSDTSPPVDTTTSDIRHTESSSEKDPIEEPSTSDTTDASKEKPSFEETTPTSIKKIRKSTYQPSKKPLVRSLQTATDPNVGVSPIPSTSKYVPPKLDPKKKQEQKKRVSRLQKILAPRKRTVGALKTSVKSPETDPENAPRTSSTVAALKRRIYDQQPPPSSTRRSYKFSTKSFKQSLVRTLQRETHPNIRVPPIPGTSSSFQSDLSPTEGQEQPIRVSRPGKIPTSKKKPTDTPKSSDTSSSVDTTPSPSRKKKEPDSEPELKSKHSLLHSKKDLFGSETSSDSTPSMPRKNIPLSPEKPHKQTLLKPLEEEEDTETQFYPQEVSPVPSTSRFVSPELGPTTTQEQPVTVSRRHDETTPPKKPIDSPRPSSTISPLKKKSSSTDTSPSSTKIRRKSSDQTPKKTIVRSLETEMDPNVGVSPVPSTSRFVSPELGPTTTQEQQVTVSRRHDETTPPKKPIDSPRPSSTISPLKKKSSSTDTSPSSTKIRRKSSDQTPKKTIVRSLETEMDPSVGVSPVPSTSRFVSPELGPTTTQEQPVTVSRRHDETTPPKKPIDSQRPSSTISPLKKKSSSTDTSPSPSKKRRKSTDRTPKKTKPLQTEADPNIGVSPVPSTSTFVPPELGPTRTQEQPVTVSRRHEVSTPPKKPSSQETTPSSSWRDLIQIDLPPRKPLVRPLQTETDPNIGVSPVPSTSTFVPPELGPTRTQEQPVTVSRRHEVSTTPIKPSSQETTPSPPWPGLILIDLPPRKPLVRPLQTETDPNIGVSPVPSTSTFVPPEIGPTKTQEQPVTVSRRHEVPSHKKKPIESPSPHGATIPIRKKPSSQETTPSPSWKRQIPTDQPSRKPLVKPLQTETDPTIGVSPVPSTSRFVPPELRPARTQEQPVTVSRRHEVPSHKKKPIESPSPRSATIPIRKKSSSQETTPSPSWKRRIPTDQPSRKPLVKPLQTETDPTIGVSPVPSTSRFVPPELRPPRTQEQPVTVSRRHEVPSHKKKPIESPSPRGATIPIRKKPSSQETTSSPSLKIRIPIDQPSRKPLVKPLQTETDPTIGVSPVPSTSRSVPPELRPPRTQEQPVTVSRSHEVPSHKKKPIESPSPRGATIPIRKKPSSQETTSSPSLKIRIPIDQSSRKPLVKPLQTETDPTIGVSPVPSTSRSVPPELRPPRTQEQPVTVSRRHEVPSHKKKPIESPSPRGTTIPIKKKPSSPETTPSPSSKSRIPTDQPSRKPLVKPLQTETDPIIGVSPVPSTSRFVPPELGSTRTQEQQITVSRRHDETTPPKKPIESPRPSSTISPLKKKSSSTDTSPSSTKIRRKSTEKTPKKSLVKSFQTETDPNVGVSPVPSTSTFVPPELGLTETQEHQVRESRPKQTLSSKKKPIVAPTTSDTSSSIDLVLSLLKKDNKLLSKQEIREKRSLLLRLRDVLGSGSSIELPSASSGEDSPLPQKHHSKQKVSKTSEKEKVKSSLADTSKKKPSSEKTTHSPTEKSRKSTDQSSKRPQVKPLQSETDPDVRVSPVPSTSTYVPPMLDPTRTQEQPVAVSRRHDVTTPPKKTTDAPKQSSTISPLKKKSSSRDTSPSPSKKRRKSTDRTPKKTKPLQTEADPNVGVSPIPSTSRFIPPELGPTKTQEHQVRESRPKQIPSPKKKPIVAPKTSDTSSSVHLDLLLLKKDNKLLSKKELRKKRSLVTAFREVFGSDSSLESVPASSGEDTPLPRKHRSKQKLSKTSEKEKVKSSLADTSKKKPSSEKTTHSPTEKSRKSTDQSSKKPQVKPLQAETDPNVRVSPVPSTSTYVPPMLGPIRTQEQPVVVSRRHDVTTPPKKTTDAPRQSSTISPLKKKSSSTDTSPSPSKKWRKSTDRTPKKTKPLQTEADPNVGVSPIPSTSRFVPPELGPTETQEHQVASDIKDSASVSKKDPIKKPSTSGSADASKKKPSSEKTTHSPTEKSRKSTDQSSKKSLVKSLQTETDPNVGVSPVPSTSRFIPPELGPTKTQEHQVASDIKDSASASKKDPIKKPSTSGSADASKKKPSSEKTTHSPTEKSRKSTDQSSKKSLVKSLQTETDPNVGVSPVPSTSTFVPPELGPTETQKQPVTVSSGHMVPSPKKKPIDAPSTSDTKRRLAKGSSTIKSLKRLIAKSLFGSDASSDSSSGIRREEKKPESEQSSTQSHSEQSEIEDVPQTSSSSVAEPAKPPAPLLDPSFLLPQLQPPQLENIPEAPPLALPGPSRSFGSELITIITPDRPPTPDITEKTPRKKKVSFDTPSLTSTIAGVIKESTDTSPVSSRFLESDRSGESSSSPEVPYSVQREFFLRRPDRPRSPNIQETPDLDEPRIPDRPGSLDLVLPKTPDRPKTPDLD